MTNLPFLKPKGITLRKLAGTSKYGFDEDDDMIESALKELMDAIDAKDHKKLVSSVKALVDCIMAREMSKEGKE